MVSTDVETMFELWFTVKLTLSDHSAGILVTKIYRSNLSVKHPGSPVFDLLLKNLLTILLFLNLCAF